MADTIYKFRATYNDGTTYSVECDSSTLLTSGETQPSGYEASGMTSAEIGSCVSSIDTQAFYQCRSLSSITLPNSVTSIGNNAFRGCTSLTSIDIPSGVTSIGTYAFNGCSGLTSIDIPSGVTTINSGAFSGCSSLTSCTIGSGVTRIASSAFRYCTSLTSIDIPNSVTRINSSAFRNCSGLTSVTIGSGVTEISQGAFGYCTSLTSITCLPTTPPSLSSDVFGHTNDCPIYVPAESLETYKSSWSTYASRIEAIPNEGGCMIKYNNSTISNWYFANDNIIKVYRNNAVCYYKITSGDTPLVFEGKYKLTLSNSSTVSAECDGTSAVTSGEVASQYSGSVVSAEIGNCVTSIGDRVFYNCKSLENITIPDSVTTIGEWVFYGCNGLTNITIPDSVTTIGKSAMRGCNSLSTVTIGTSVTSISASVFFNCTGLTSVTIEATTPPSIGTLVFENTNECPIYVPSGSVSAYQSAWSEYGYSSRIQAIPNS